MLASAKRDLKALSNMLDGECFDDEVFGFHAQQAAEKALKAWLNVLSKTYPFTHDLGRLLHDLDQAGAEVQAHWTLLDLTSYAVRFRYGSASVDDDPLDRTALLDDIRSLIAHVSGMVDHPSDGANAGDD